MINAAIDRFMFSNFRRIDRQWILFTVVLYNAYRQLCPACVHVVKRGLFFQLRGGLQVKAVTEARSFGDKVNLQCAVCVS